MVFPLSSTIEILILPILLTMPSLPLNSTLVRILTSCPTSGFQPSRSNALGSGNALRSGKGFDFLEGSDELFYAFVLDAIIRLFKIILRNTVRQYLTFDIKSIDVITI